MNWSHLILHENFMENETKLVFLHRSTIFFCANLVGKWLSFGYCETNRHIGGPFDTWGGSLWLSFVIKIFFFYSLNSCNIQFSFHLIKWKQFFSFSAFQHKTIFLSPINSGGVTIDCSLIWVKKVIYLDYVEQKLLLK